MQPRVALHHVDHPHLHVGRAEPGVGPQHLGDRGHDGVAGLGAQRLNRWSRSSALTSALFW